MRTRTLPVTQAEGLRIERLIRVSSLDNERTLSGAVRAAVPRLQSWEIQEVVEYMLMQQRA